MVLDAKIDRDDLRRARRMIRNHPFNDPQEAVLNAAKKVAPDLSRRIKSAAPRRTGKLRRSIKPLAAKHRGGVICGVKLWWYWVFVNRRTQFLTRSFVEAVVLDQIADAVVELAE